MYIAMDMNIDNTPCGHTCTHVLMWTASCQYIATGSATITASYTVGSQWSWWLGVCVWNYGVATYVHVHM